VNKLQVKVEAGIFITKLNGILTDNQMAISSLGAISDQTIAGAMSTANHGTGKNYGILSSSVSGKYHQKQLFYQYSIFQSILIRSLKLKC
jgi:hypothetical protein